MTDQIRTMVARLRSLFRRRAQLDRELDAEMRSHLEMAVDRNLLKA